MVAPPALGALGMTFTAMRGLQVISLISIIGMTSNFISEMVSANYTPPSALVGTLVVACIVTVYTAITYILYWDSMLPLLISTGADGLCLIAVIVVACVVGKPVSFLSCTSLPDKGNTANFMHSLFLNLARKNYFEWVDADKATCFEMKAIWGLSISLCVLFFISAVTSACLWKCIKGGRPGPVADPKDIE